jgi:chromosome segregation ATPase
MITVKEIQYVRNNSEMGFNKGLLKLATDLARALFGRTDDANTYCRLRDSEAVRELLRAEQPTAESQQVATPPTTNGQLYTLLERMAVAAECNNELTQQVINQTANIYQETMLRTAPAEASYTQKAWDNLTAKNDTLSAEIATLEDKLGGILAHGLIPEEEARRDRDLQLAEIARLSTELAEARTDCRECTEIATLQDKLSNLVIRDDGRQEAMTLKNLRIKKLEEEIATLKAALDAAREAGTELVGQERERNAEIATLKTENTSLKTAMKNIMEHAREAADDLVVSLEEITKDLEAANAIPQNN